jgi:uncharacterized protein YecA (UPF0149 family)
MNLLMYSTGILMIVLVGYTVYDTLSLWNKNTHSKIIEGLENNSSDNNNSCENDSKVLIYKNAGIIQNLQESVNTLSKQVNTLILNNDKQEVDIQNLKTLEAKVEQISSQAQQLATDNKNRLLEMAKESKARSDAISKQVQSMPSP